MQRTKKILPHRILYFIRKNQRHAPAGKQLRKITQIVEKKQIMPAVDPHVFSLERADQALKLVADGGSVGKVLIQI